MTTGNPVHGAVLSGGGAFGAYEVGVLKALLEDGKIDPAVFSGTSVGAYTAAIMCQGGGGKEAAAKLEKIWLENVAETSKRVGNGVYRVRLNPIEFFNPRAWMTGPAKPMLDLVSDATFFLRLGAQKAAEFAQSGEPLGRRFLDLFDLSAFVSIEPFRKLLADTVDLDAIRRSSKKVRITATKWDKAGTGVDPAEVFRNADMTAEDGLKVILASAAIPILFPPARLDHHWYVDGGLAANTPVSPAVEAGANILHVVDLQADVHELKIDDLDSTYAALVRVASIAISAAVRREIQQARQRNSDLRAASATTGYVEIHRYHPQTPLGTFPQVLDFQRPYLEELIARGYADAKAHDCTRGKCAL